MKFVQRFLELTGIKQVGPDDLNGFPDGIYKVRKNAFPYGHTGVLIVKENKSYFAHLSKDNGFIIQDDASKYLRGSKSKFRIKSIAFDDASAGQRLGEVDSMKLKWGENPKFPVCENPANYIVEGISYSETIDRISLYLEMMRSIRN